MSLNILDTILRDNLFGTNLQLFSSFIATLLNYSENIKNNHKRILEFKTLENFSSNTNNSPRESVLDEDILNILLNIKSLILQIIDNIILFEEQLNMNIFLMN